MQEILNQMREILINYGLILIWCITLLEIIFTAVLFIDYYNKRDPIILCMALVGVGLCYDALIIGMGGLILPPVLPLLSRLRFFFHGLLIPLNVMICAYAAGFFRKARIAAWIVTGLLMAAGAAAGWMREIELANFNEIVRYVPCSPRDSWMEMVNSVLTYGSVVLVMLTGIWVSIRKKSPSILLAGVLMFGFAALGPATGNADLIFLISMFGELFMLLFYMIFEKRHVD